MGLHRRTRPSAGPVVAGALAALVLAAAGTAAAVGSVSDEGNARAPITEPAAVQGPAETGRAVATPDTAESPQPTLPPPPLVEGMSGPRVTDLQRRLHALGYQVRQVTGTFDSETAHAVLAFQKVNGLPRDRIVDGAVRRALADPVRPRPRNSMPGFRMEVDLTTQVAYAIQDNVVTHVYDVSTGAPQSPTPPGEFTVQYRIDGMRHAPLGDLWRPVYFTFTGIAFHGNEPVRPFPASHGCVRLTDPSIDELFVQLDPGTPVSVYAS